MFLAFGVFAAVTFAVLCGPAIVTLYEAEVRGLGAARARLLVIGQALNLFTQLTFVTLVASGRRRIYPIATLVGVITNVDPELHPDPAILRRRARASRPSSPRSSCSSILGYAMRDLPIRPLPWRPIAVVAVSGALLAACAARAADRSCRGRSRWSRRSLLYPALLHVLRIDGPGGLVSFVRATRFQDA